MFQYYFQLNNNKNSIENRQTINYFELNPTVLATKKQQFEK